jgi:mannose-1-phosphate guanylyltransferase/mannose-1-phosphate guanylyltransferase/mannose-6-phosphate isomerase
MIPVILSGGSGTRLWPLSRTKYPKQFNDLFEDSLLALTIKRVSNIGTPWIITGAQHKNLTEKKKKDLKIKEMFCIYEPVGKNTAPAIALLVHLLSSQKKEDEIVSIFPADQLIENETDFCSVITESKKLAQEGKVVTLGILPSFPSTGFGYIQTAQPIETTDQSISTTKNAKSFSVIKFHEKPNYEDASEFIKQGSYFWNAGIFTFKVSVMKQLFEKYQPQLWNKISQIKIDLSNIDEIYPHLENISIDYAIMENLTSDKLSCIPCDIGWDDVGSWDSVAQIYSNKHLISKASVKNHNSDNNFIFSLDNKVYALCNVSNLIVVDTRDALLICEKGKSQDVKHLVEQLKIDNNNTLSDHVFEERPWGKFEVLKDTSYYKSKLIQVDPNCQLSYQSHNHREEHWTVVKGSGEVMLNEEVIPIKTGSHIFIPKNAKHRIKNTGTEKLEFVEVQVGTYFGEDDIIRYKDDYNRINQ